MGSPVSLSVHRHNLVSPSPPTVFKGFWWNYPVIVPMTWRCAYFIEVMLDWFLPELWPFVSFSHFINRSSCLSNSSLFTCYNFSTVSLVFATPLAVSVDFSETFQLLFQWPEEDHIIPRSGLTAFYQSYGPLSVLAILSTEVLVSATPPTFFSRDFDESFQLLFTWPGASFTKPFTTYFRLRKIVRCS